MVLDECMGLRREHTPRLSSSGPHSLQDPVPLPSHGRMKRYSSFPKNLSVSGKMEVQYSCDMEVEGIALLLEASWVASALYPWKGAPECP